MTALITRTVEDAALDLIRAAHMLDHRRMEADRIVLALEARWAANRGTAAPPLSRSACGAG